MVVKRVVPVLEKILNKNILDFLLLFHLLVLVVLLARSTNLSFSIINLDNYRQLQSILNKEEMNKILFFVKFNSH